MFLFYDSGNIYNLFFLSLAVPEPFLQSEVRSILKDKIVVGHEVGEDFRVIRYFPSTAHVRNSAEFFHDFQRNRTPSLKDLAEQKLGWSIQTGEHSSVQDASAALQLYLNNRREWDEEVEKFEKIKKCLGNTTSLSTLLEAYRGGKEGCRWWGKLVALEGMLSLV